MIIQNVLESILHAFITKNSNEKVFGGGIGSGAGIGYTYGIGSGAGSGSGCYDGCFTIKSLERLYIIDKKNYVVISCGNLDSAGCGDGFGYMKNVE